MLATMACPPPPRQVENKGFNPTIHFYIDATRIALQEKSKISMAPKILVNVQGSREEDVPVARQQCQCCGQPVMYKA